jgi:hypothetical protein
VGTPAPDLQRDKVKCGTYEEPISTTNLGVNVTVMKELPEDAMVFAMAHELKHHLVDSDLEMEIRLAKRD